MKILITGAGGFIGRSLVEHLTLSGIDVYPVFRCIENPHLNVQLCDLREYESVRKMIDRTDPDVIVHTAATSNIEECQKNMLDSWENNVMATMNLIKSVKRNVHFVYLSTAEVFDGEIGAYIEESHRNPIHWYGHTKVASEDIVSNLMPLHTIIRLSYQYGYDITGKNFLHRTLEMLRNDREVSAADDLIYSPTYVGTTLLALEEIIMKRLTGFYNIADEGSSSKYQLICNLARKLNKPSHVTAESSDIVFTARRPKNTSLDVSKFAKSFRKAKPLDQHEGLNRFCTDSNQMCSSIL